MADASYAVEQSEKKESFGYECGDRVYLSDSYKLVTSQKLNIKNKDFGQNTQIPTEAMKILNSSYDENNIYLDSITKMEVESIKISLGLLKYNDTCKFPKLKEDFNSDTPTGCKKIQLTSQIKENVCYDKEKIEKMSSAEKNILKILEAHQVAFNTKSDFDKRLITALSLKTDNADLYLPFVNSTPMTPYISVLTTFTLMFSNAEMGSMDFYYLKNIKAHGVFEYMYKRCIELGYLPQLKIPQNKNVLKEVVSNLNYDKAGINILIEVYIDKPQLLNTNLRLGWERFVGLAEGVSGSKSRNDFEILKENFLNKIDGKLL